MTQPFDMDAFSPMLAKAPDAKYPLRFPMYVSIKYDGIRVPIPAGQPLTRSKKQVANRKLRALLASHPELHYLDGEIIHGDPADPLCYNRTNSVVMSHDADISGCRFFVFDVIDYNLPFEDRYNHLVNSRFPDWVVVVEQWLVHDKEQLDEIYARVTAAGHEGLIGRVPDGPYKNGRSTPKEQYMLKFKPEEDSEFEILGFYEAMENTNEAFINELGQTYRSTAQEGLVGKGMLGGFNARDIHTGVTFNVAPGKLTHEQRLHIWNNQSMYAKLIGKYRHFPVGVVEKPRHGRWIGWRDKADLGG